MTTALLLSVLLSGLVPGDAAPPSLAAGEGLSYDAATNTVTFDLVAGPFSFNGYRSGEATLLVPSKANIVINFVNKDGTPHSAIVISGEGPIPNSPDPAIPRAYTTKVLEGLPQEGRCCQGGCESAMAQAPLGPRRGGGKRRGPGARAPRATSPPPE